MNPAPTQLAGEYIRLEPLNPEAHLDGLQRAGRNNTIFEWFAEDYSSPEKMRSFVETAIEAQDEGTAVPFATIHQESGDVIGSTRFCTIRPANRSVEIGWTWLTPDQQRTPANTEAKYLMLRLAFEEWGCVRVEFETAAANVRARKALNRIGATEEGLLRRHMLIHGEPMDSIYYSVIENEWSGVHRLLTRKLDDPPL
jgi:RimJ/RimL family protein N-acetyltransferase